MSRLSRDDGLALLGIARRAISSAIIENCLPDFPPFSVSLSVLRDAFVTLYRGGKLRGCVGQVENPVPLAEAVARAAINSALHDPRFPPVGVEEVASLEIEISVLSPLEPVAPDAIIAGQHGLLIVEDAAQALGSKFKGRAAGTFGVAAAISFYPAKVLGCFGDGGAVITDRKSVV